MEVGDKVTHSNTRYGSSVGEIVEVSELRERPTYYKVRWANGKVICWYYEYELKLAEV